MTESEKYNIVHHALLTTHRGFEIVGNEVRKSGKYNTYFNFKGTGITITNAPRIDEKH